MHLRLALYSDQVIAENSVIDERVLRLIGVSRPRIGYVSSSPDPDRVYFDEKHAYYANLGAELTSYIDSETTDLDGALQILLSCDAIQLTGGNTFSFLRWLKARRVLPVLCGYAKRGGVLIGTSAGAILMTPAITIATLSGDMPDSIVVDETAMALVGFHFWPHYIPGAELEPNAVRVLRKLPNAYACPDGSGLIIDGSQTELYGSVRLLSPVPSAA